MLLHSLSLSDALQLTFLIQLSVLLINLFKRFPVILCIIHTLAVLGKNDLLLTICIQTALLIGHTVFHGKHIVCIVVSFCFQIGRYMAILINILGYLCLLYTSDAADE